MAGTPPAHWTQHSGPNQWYVLSHPPTWRAELTDGTVSFVAPDAGGLLTLSSFWLDYDHSTDVEKVVDLQRLFPQRRRVRRLKLLETGQASIGFEGQSPVEMTGAWWQRLFRRKQWRRWRVWCLRHKTVYVLAMFLQTEKYDPEAETMVGMILNTLSFNSRPAVPPEIFSERVAELARRKFPLLECEMIADFQLKLGESKVNLFNFYRSYLNSPDQFEAIVLPALTTVVQVQGWGKEQTEPDFAAVRDRIMPMLYPEEVWAERFPNFISAPWVAGLVILYVVDESQAYWYIRQDLLDTWGLSLEGLNAVALENLDRYFDAQPMDFSLAGDEGGPRLLIPARPDAYNSARLLSEKFHARLREVMGAEFAVGVPSRDFFVAVSLESAETIEHIRKKVGDDFRQMDHPLSEQLLLVTQDGVTEYVPWEG